MSYRWIPWAFAGALAIVVVANGVLTYFAVSSSTGLVTEHPFDSGNDYNRILEAGAAQDALGWHGAVSFSEMAPQRGELAVELLDSQDRPLNKLSVTAEVTRPIEPMPAIALQLNESAAGRYTAPVMLSRLGQWEVHVVARRGGDLYELTRRIIVK